MKNKEIKKRIFRAIGITEKQEDLVGKILSLEEDSERVHSVELAYKPRFDEAGFYAQINLLIDFKDLKNFRGYLRKNGFPVEHTQFREEVYSLRTNGIVANFSVPDYYPRK